MAFVQVSHAYEIKEVPRHSGELGSGNAILACGKLGVPTSRHPQTLARSPGPAKSAGGRRSKDLVQGDLCEGTQKECSVFGILPARTTGC